MSKTVCIFSALYYPNIGGVESYTKHLARALARQGHRVFIVTSNVYDLPEREDLEKGVEIFRLPCFKLLKGRYPFPRKNGSYKRLMALLRQQPIDYVVINTRFYGHTLEGLALAESKGVVPLVIDHGSAHLAYSIPGVDSVVEWYEHGITRIVKGHRPAFYGVSQKSCDWLGHFGISSQGVLNNSIDAASFRASASSRDFRAELGLGADDFVVAFTGRFIPEKGIRALIEVAGLLREREDIRFLFAGDGALRKELSDSRSGNIEILGRLTPEDVSAFLRDADLFCLPSRSEGFSTSILECASWGVMPLVTDVGGAAELIPTEDYGVILEAVDPKDIAERIAFFADHREEGRRRGCAIRERVETQFSWDATTHKVLQACERAQEGLSV